MKEITCIEINSENDQRHEKEQTKNMTKGNQIEGERKIHTIRKKIIHYYDLGSEDSSKLSGEQAELWKNEKPNNDHEKPRNKEEFEKALVTNEMTLSNPGRNIFIGDSTATSHMTSNKTGVYNLTPTKGSVMFGNGQIIICTHKEKLDLICKHKDGSMARETWDVKIVPQ